jgi:hypothetical protein
MKREAYHKGEALEGKSFHRALANLLRALAPSRAAMMMMKNSTLYSGRRIRILQTKMMSS